MTIWGAVYKLLIGPLELFFETVFSVANRVLHDPGLSIIFLSLAMNFLVLPLYRRADALQAEERDQAAAMKPWVDHIKRTFRGDERFMMLQMYYKQNGYKQTDALKGTISLLLEIPFFIAAYRFLSGLSLLQGVSFGPIRDLGAPDALLTIAGMRVNILPILMTLINCISAAIYMKGFPLKNKLQMYGMALVFLVLLYTSPAGLVFYWTLNNIFSLVKNIFYKLKKPKLVLSILSSLAGLAGLVFIFAIHPLSTMKRQLFLTAAFLLLQLPILLCLFVRRTKTRREIPFGKSDARLFLYSCLFMTVLTGILIPSAILNASPAEFVSVTVYRSPLRYLLSSGLIAAGTFLVWFGIFFRLAAPAGKKVFAFGMFALSAAAAVNYMFFGTGYGTLSDTLRFDTAPVIGTADMLKNVVILAAAVLLLFLIWRKKDSIVRALALAMCLAVLGMSVMNVLSTGRELKNIRQQIIKANEEVPSFTLSKNGRNVIVLMLDRAAAYYLPYLMYEKPELKDALDGFTFYPNAVSFGTATNAGAPGLYGGYEYTPEHLNARPELSLEEKNDEALKVMPVLFSQNGYRVTVCDPSYAGYSWIPDLTIYDEYPEIRKFITLGRFAADGFDSGLFEEHTDELRNRNFFCFSLFRISPLFIQPTLYNEGNYNAASSYSFINSISGETAFVQTRDDISHASGLDQRFMNAYAVLDQLPNIGEITDSAEDTFLMLANDSTHQPILLQEPAYVPSERIDNSEYDAAREKRYAEDGSYVTLKDMSQMTHWHINMAALLKLGAWFDYLRANDVWDNTRIILVSDHAWALWQNKDLVLQIQDNPEGEPSNWDLTKFNCLLLVKDFDSTGFTVDRTFMTNADTPSLAAEGLIDSPVNPFTGKAIDMSEKEKSELHLLYVKNSSISENCGNVFLPDYWFSVHDDIFVRSNWQFLGVY